MLEDKKQQLFPEMLLSKLNKQYLLFQLLALHFKIQLT